MGLYWTTKFYRDINNIDDFIVLNSMDKIIDDNDVRRGYVCKNELLNFSKMKDAKMKDEIITKDSYIVEYHWNTYDGGCIETRRFQVQ